MFFSVFNIKSRFYGPFTLWQICAKLAGHNCNTYIIVLHIMPLLIMTILIIPNMGDIAYNDIANNRFYL